MTLGRMAVAVPAAVDDLEELLGDERARSAAASALVMAGEAALPAIIRSLDHPDKVTRNQIVFALGRHADAAIATPVLRRVLVHSDTDVRECGVAVVADLIARGGPEEGKPYVEDLAARLMEDTSAPVRRGAALALLNMKSFAAQAESALRYAAEKEQDSLGRDFANKALQGLKPEQERSSRAGPNKQEVAPQQAFESLATEKDIIQKFRAVRATVGLASAPDERPTTRRDLLRNCLALINNALRPNEKKDCITFGELSVLDRAGECWVVEVDQGLMGTQFAYFDDMGRLLLAWRAPEG
jgi:HEAT repeat protein